MVPGVLEWFDNHSASYWAIAWLGSLSLLVRAWWALRPPCGAVPAPHRSEPWVDGLVILVFLFAWRWPLLLVANEFNPDESQLVAGAITLARDPVFWRSVDGTTSGPLNFYALVPWHWIGAPINYLTARATGVLLVTGALWFCQRTLAAAFGRAAAWLGVLPAACFFATTTYGDFVHYSSEHPSLVLIAASVWLLAGRGPGDRRRLWLGCFIAGLAPFAKLQVAPIGVTLIGWGLWLAWTEAKAARARIASRIGFVVAAAAAPTLLVASLVIVTGQAETAWRRYILGNAIYAREAHTLQSALGAMSRLATNEGRMLLFLGTALALALIVITWCLVRRQRLSPLFLPGLWLSLAAVVAVVAPGREFLHYTLLLPVPLTILLGAAVGCGWRSAGSAWARRLLAGSFLLAGAALPLLIRCFQPLPPIWGTLLYDWQHPRTSAGIVVHALARPTDRLGVWGWACSLYVETGLPQATRDAHSIWAITPSPLRDYHRACYLQDLRRNEPAVFVDAVGPGAFGLEYRPDLAHESFPELAAYIREHYTLAAELGYCRVYLHNRISPRPDLPHLHQLAEQGRWRERLTSTPPSLNSLQDFQRKMIGRQDVVMLLPPAQIEWALDNDAREVVLEFGFDPVAYHVGHSNGATVLLDLVTGDNRRTVYQRSLNPASQPDDRGPQSATVPLPPFGRDTRLVLRTDPGPGGDTAWDWVYLAHLQMTPRADYLPTQFPGFSRVPERVDAAYAAVWVEEREYLFLMPAPSALTFALNGNEKRVSFGYGFRPGAYSNGGRTDGAVFRVELVRSDEPAKVLFERWLQPVEKPDDQGRQNAEVELPAVRRDDHLVVTIDIGPNHNPAWDWTYLSSLRLE